MSTLKTNTIKNTDDVEMYLAKAWVNFNGTGTVAIRAAGNVSSITDNGTGLYTINFTNAMSDANYLAVCGNSYNRAMHTQTDSGTYTRSSTQCQVGFNNVGGYQDAQYIEVAVFR